MSAQRSCKEKCLAVWSSVKCPTQQHTMPQSKEVHKRFGRIWCICGNVKSLDTPSQTFVLFFFIVEILKTSKLWSNASMCEMKTRLISQSNHCLQFSTWRSFPHLLNGLSLRVSCYIKHKSFHRFVSFTFLLFFFFLPKNISYFIWLHSDSFRKAVHATFKSFQLKTLQIK